MTQNTLSFLNAGGKHTDECVADVLLELSEQIDCDVDLDAKMRFLVAHDLSVSHATAALRSNVLWCARSLPISFKSVKGELEKNKFSYDGRLDAVDRKPVITIRSALFDPNLRDVDTCIDAIVFLLELVRTEHPRSQVTIFYDRRGFSMRNLDVELLKKAVEVLSANYPEIINKVYVHPVGALFETAFMIVKAFLPPRTKNKIVKVKAIEEIQNVFPDSVL